jgi:transcription elongation factor Elf1
MIEVGKKFKRAWDCGCAGSVTSIFRRASESRWTATCQSCGQRIDALVSGGVVKAVISGRGNS